MLQLICEKDQTLKQFTDENCAQASFCWSHLLKRKDIKVNDKRVGKGVYLSKGDVVCYFLSQKQLDMPAFYPVYEDENIIIVDKESGVNAEAVFAELSRKTGGRCAFIHRLDRNTQGLMVFAKNVDTEQRLLSAFKQRRVEKIYHALCFGSFAKKEDTLTAYLEKQEEKLRVKIFDTPTPNTEKIVTAYKVLEEKDGVSKVEVTLHTGKTHQIRAHLAHIGHPIVGDMKYGDAEKNHELNASRQRLIAKYLSFTFTGSLAYLNDKKFHSRFPF